MMAVGWLVAGADLYHICMLVVFIIYMNMCNLVYGVWSVVTSV